MSASYDRLVESVKMKKARIFPMRSELLRLAAVIYAMCDFFWLRKRLRL